MKATQQLHDLGQSLWLDNIARDLLDRGTLKRYIDELSVTGLTSNEAGIDVDALAARLQEEGAASFSNSWNELLGVLEAKSAALQKAG